MNNSTVILEKIGKTAVITLNRPQRRNAMDESVMQELAAAIKDVREDRSVHSVVLTGAGGHFCSGADLKGEGMQGDEKGLYVREMLADAHRWLPDLIDLEKPVIAAVDGFALGAGLSLALAADFVIASDRARLVCSFARVGLLPDLSLLYVLPRLVGLPRAKELVFTARDIPAEEALEMGLVQSVVPAERLREVAIDYAQRFDNAPTHVLGMAKGILNRSFETNRDALLKLEAAAQAICAGSSYHTEAVRRFVNREPAAYAGAERLF